MYRRYRFALCLIMVGLQDVIAAKADQEMGAAPQQEQRELQALIQHRDDLVETRQQFQDRVTDGPQVEPVLNSLREMIAQLDGRIEQVERQIANHRARQPNLKHQHKFQAVPVEPGDTARPDKSIYNLFNPTPRDLMREMSTDRPDKTESAYTVDAGHIQVETDLLSYSRAKETGETGGTRSEAWAVASLNLKLGLRNNMDLQLIIDTYSLVETKDTRSARALLRSTHELYGLLQTASTSNVADRVGSLAEAHGLFLSRHFRDAGDQLVSALDFSNIPERIDSLIEARKLILNGDMFAKNSRRQSGFGDVTLRLKMNVWGNDGGTTAFAVMPFIKFPTNRDGLGNNAVEGGIIFPLALELPAGWGMGLMTEVDFLRNDADHDYHASWINSITFSHDITRNLAGYVEFFSEVSSEHGVPWVGTFDCGLTYGLTENIQLDAGINIGVTESADDYNPFVGLSWRF